MQRRRSTGQAFESLVCDTGPLNYLIQIDAINVLTELFSTILIPYPVHQELSAAAAPLAVRSWAAHLPSWCVLQNSSGPLEGTFPGLSGTDIDVLSLARENGTAVLLDDLAARIVARRLGLPVLGTLGLLELADSRRLLHLPDAFSRLKKTNIRIATELYDEILRRNGFGAT